MDFDVQPRTRKCAKSGRAFEPGEVIFSALVSEGGEVNRYDFAADQWEGPPEKAIGWWKAQVPDNNTRKVNWAPNDVMLHYFEEIADRPDKADVRYVLMLLMIRRKVLRWDDTTCADDGDETMVVYSGKKETSYEVPVVQPDAARTEAIQDELAELLFSNTTES